MPFVSFFTILWRAALLSMTLRLKVLEVFEVFEALKIEQITMEHDGYERKGCHLISNFAAECTLRYNRSVWTRGAEDKEPLMTKYEKAYISFLEACPLSLKSRLPGLSLMKWYKSSFSG
jgi:hypothetical protein